MRILVRPRRTDSEIGLKIHQGPTTSQYGPKFAKIRAHTKVLYFRRHTDAKSWNLVFTTVQYARLWFELRISQ